LNVKVWFNGVDLISRLFDLIDRLFELVDRLFELVDRLFDLINRLDFDFYIHILFIILLLSRFLSVLFEIRLSGLNG